MHNKKALVKQEKGKIVVEPVEDVLAFKGALQHKAMKGKRMDEIIKIEERAWVDRTR